VAIVANAESERGHNAATAFPVYLDQETFVTPSNRTSENTSVCQIPFGIRTRVIGWLSYRRSTQDTSGTV